MFNIIYFCYAIELATETVKDGRVERNNYEFQWSTDKTILTWGADYQSRVGAGDALLDVYNDNFSWINTASQDLGNNWNLKKYRQTKDHILVHLRNEDQSLGYYASFKIMNQNLLNQDTALQDILQKTQTEKKDWFALIKTFDPKSTVPTVSVPTSSHVEHVEKEKLSTSLLSPAKKADEIQDKYFKVDNFLEEFGAKLAKSFSKTTIVRDTGLPATKGTKANYPSGVFKGSDNSLIVSTYDKKADPLYAEVINFEQNRKIPVFLHYGGQQYQGTPTNPENAFHASKAYFCTDTTGKVQKFPNIVDIFSKIITTTPNEALQNKQNLIVDNTTEQLKLNFRTWSTEYGSVAVMFLIKLFQTETYLTAPGKSVKKALEDVGFTKEAHNNGTRIYVYENSPIEGTWGVGKEGIGENLLGRICTVIFNSIYDSQTWEKLMEFLKNFKTTDNALDLKKVSKWAKEQREKFKKLPDYTKLSDFFKSNKFEPKRGLNNKVDFIQTFQSGLPSFPDAVKDVRKITINKKVGGSEDFFGIVLESNTAASALKSFITDNYPQIIPQYYSGDSRIITLTRNAADRLEKAVFNKEKVGGTDFIMNKP